MWASEKKLAARGAKFYFIIKQDMPENERTLWQDSIARLSPLSKCFRRVDFGYDAHPLLFGEWNGWNLIKVSCRDAQISVRLSDVKSFYNKIFLQFSEWFIKFCRDGKVECKSYDFRILFRLHPPESQDEFVPIPSLDDIASKVVSPPRLLPKPPTTQEEMFDLAKTTLSVPEVFDETFKVAEEHKAEVYGSYGIRTEQHANTYELDVWVPGPSAQAEPIRSLQGELCYELILQSTEKATPDFDRIVRALLTKLLENAVIDPKKIDHIVNNPAEYFQARQWRTRFILNFDLKMMDLTDERGRALNSVKKDIQCQLKNTIYSLFGVVSYKLTNEDLTRIDGVIKDISYFKDMNRDQLFVDLRILLHDAAYDRVVEIARKTDEILNLHKIIDLDTSPGIAIDVEDAKKRWNSAVSDAVTDGKTVAAFIFLREIFGLPLQVFTDVRESLYEDLRKIAAEPSIGVTLTSDNQTSSSRYGCFVASS